ncbi:unnamed protein product [Paramecium pentaurelia]|uniref:Uncharacterized protein n=1 Tax=Paramecium pentaurelia TaxID=43138 RepID=A0A8S1UDS0_9CILI|nr:unnamed protein product [Paramecium pentaurelia]
MEIIDYIRVWKLFHQYQMLDCLWFCKLRNPDSYLKIYSKSNSISYAYS